ncbi:aldehyde dehydrogenase family protein [Alkalimonas sp.]|uniref:aldehyde dehydrogenase family protein n=1 Tax=Alkalimonas sp. TaxID=1872453 RepID=UPI00263B5C81|nr:aldehyde dehydrogenase family protein [Alkalimonas sp.]MCC5825051.1 aldehyde dehydrogenase family protein [Alkalimonas sp.]
MKIRNPRTGRLDFNLNEVSLDEVAHLAANLRASQPLWWQLGMAARVKAMQDFAEQLAVHREALVAAVAEDTGRWSESELEVDVTISTIQRWCKDAPELLAEAPPRKAQIPFLEIQPSYLPFEVVGVISPWNFPLLLSLVDAIPALLAGCAVVIKPSEVTSRFVAPLQEAIRATPALAAVLQIVTGAGETGQAVIQHVDTLCFTGSVATGRRVGELCAQQFIPAFLELGGKDAAIVCDDADIEVATSALCWGSMVNAGQSCMSLERIYVHECIADAFISRLVEKVKKLRHNYPDIRVGEIGPVISDKQVAVIRQQLDDAFEKGARALCGGQVLELGGGFYCEPTVLDQVSNNMQIVTEETFAAIVVVQRVQSNDEAVRLANDSKYGLSAAVFSQDLANAYRISATLKAGGISINDASLTGFVHEAEKQSFQCSGMGGSRMGAESIRRFIRKKSFIRNTGVPSPWWFKA